MVEKSMFFGGDPEPQYNQPEVEEYYKTFYQNGVFRGQFDELEVVEKDPPDMMVRLRKGKAWIEGYWYFEDENSGVLHEIEEADGINPRIDRIVLRLTREGDPSGHIKCVVKKGEPSVTPSSPALQQDNTIYEISLYKIVVSAGVSAIYNSDIFDERQWASTKISPILETVWGAL